MLHTTFRKVKEAGACESSYRKFAKYKGGVKAWGKDTPFGLDEVLEVCGLRDAIWCLWAVIEPADKEIRLFFCDCSERVLPKYEKRYPKDDRPRKAIKTARLYAEGKISEEELNAARADARDAWLNACLDASDDAWDAWLDASDAALAAWNAWHAVAVARDDEASWQEHRFRELLEWRNTDAIHS